MALRIRHIAVLLLGLVLVAVACGRTEPEPLPDIDATVEARVQEQRDLDAAIDARVQEQLAADAAKEATAEAMVSPDPGPTAIATPPKRKSCSFEEKVNTFNILMSVKGEIGSKTPITLAILFAPKL